MFKVEHLVESIFPLLAFSDPPWAKHYKDTPSTVQTSGIFGWLNKHEKQMGQDRNRYILVPNITKISILENLNVLIKTNSSAKI